MPRFLEEKRSDTYGGKLRIMEQLELRQESGGSRLYLMDKPIVTRSSQ